MTIKNKKGRLDKTLPDVQNWARGMAERPTFNPQHNYIQQYYDRQAEFFEALNHLDYFGMAEVGNSLIAAGIYPNTPSLIHMAHGFSRIIHANGINILRLKERKKTILLNLDLVTHNILGAVALGMPELARKFHRIVLDGLEQGYGIKNGHNDPGPETL
uniref:hypothetical protein n=1 Tax=Entomohabitans teleogrylli TaxID=1384589 RepID=UPI000B03D2AB